MSDPLIAVPMGLEALLVRSGARRAHVHRTGIGPARSRRAARALLAEPGESLLVLGFCGGLAQGSVPGEVVVAERVFAAPDEGHGDQAVSCEGVEGLAAALAQRGLHVRRGSIVCVSRLALGERRTALRRDGAVAVDMESVWLGAGAGQRPFAVVRVILDSPSHELLGVRAPASLVRAARVLRTVAMILHEWAPED